MDETQEIIENVVEETPELVDGNGVMWMIIGAAALALGEIAWFKCIKPLAKKVRTKFEKRCEEVVIEG